MLLRTRAVYKFALLHLTARDELHESVSGSIEKEGWGTILDKEDEGQRPC